MRTDCDLVLCVTKCNLSVSEVIWLPLLLRNYMLPVIKHEVTRNKKADNNIMQLLQTLPLRLIVVIELQLRSILFNVSYFSGGPAANNTVVRLTLDEREEKGFQNAKILKTRVVRD